MNLKEYSEKALRTAQTHRPYEQLLLNACLGLAGESGEVCDLIKKHIYQGHNVLHKDEILNEVGDVLWYINLLLHTTGLTFEQTMEYNINKLQKRYPNGFEVEKSLNREEE